MDSTWIRYRELNEKTGIVEIKSGVLIGSTNDQCLVGTMSGHHTVNIENVVTKWNV